MRARKAAFVTAAALVVAALPTARASPPGWFARLRAAAVARARTPLEGEALDVATVEAARARAAGLPQLRLSERSRLALDGAYALELEAGASVPVVAPEVGADRRLAAARLGAARRQLRAQRRSELHDALADAVALLATEARLRALDRLATALREAGPEPSVRPPLRLVDIRLLAAGRASQRRRADALREELAGRLGVRIPPLEARPATAGDAAQDRGTAGDGATRFLRDPLGLTAAELEPARCQAASDAVVLARLAAADVDLSAALARARARPRADLDLVGALRLASDGREPSYSVRVGVSVRLPPWSPVTGAASLAGGAAGLEQSLTAAWPNRAPAAPPATARDEPASDAADAVRRRLGLLVGQEADLLARRRILRGALVAQRATARRRRREDPPATLAAAYRTATLTLQRVDAEEALGVTRLDAALLCGVLPP